MQACLISHGACHQDIVGYMKQLALIAFEPEFWTRAEFVFIWRFLTALPIAAVGGGVTGWRLAQFQPAYSISSSL
jgi:hypothetical protein